MKPVGKVRKLVPIKNNFYSAAAQEFPVFSDTGGLYFINEQYQREGLYFDEDSRLTNKNVSIAWLRPNSL